MNAFLNTVHERFGQQDKDLDTSLWRMVNGKAVYNDKIGGMSEAVAAQTYDYAQYINNTTVPEIVRAATAYRDAISSTAKAQELMRKGGFDFEQLAAWGYSQNAEGHWVQKKLGSNATDEQRVENIAHRKLAHTTLVKFFLPYGKLSVVRRKPQKIFSVWQALPRICTATNRTPMIPGLSPVTQLPITVRMTEGRRELFGDGTPLLSGS